MNGPSQVSVIIPVYNGAGYVSRAIESALDQEQVNHEVIVVDDGSSDDLASVLARFGDKIRLVRHQENKGLPAARNTGVRAAQSDIIALLDADDWWSKEKLREQVAVLRENPEIDIVFTDFLTVDQCGVKTGWQGGIKDQMPTLGLQLRELGTHVYELVGDVHYALIRHTSFMHPSSMSMRKQMFESAGYFDESMRYCEDLEFWIRLASCGRVALIDSTLVTIEARADSWGRHVIKNSEHILGLYESLPDRFPRMPDSVRTHIDRFVEAKHLALGWHYRQVGQRSLARTHYITALKSRFSCNAIGGLLKTLLPL